MPQHSDRQRTAMQRLTERQLEALGRAALGHSPRSRWGRPDGTRSNMGGASNRMVDELRANGLLEGDYSISFAGVDAVLLNIARVPEPHRAEVKAAAQQLKPELDAKADQAAAAREAAQRERQERAAARKAEREAAILEKLPALASEHGLVISDDSGREEPFTGQLIAFWEAVVNADQAL